MYVHFSSYQSPNEISSIVTYMYSKTDHTLGICYSVITSNMHYTQLGELKIVYIDKSDGVLSWGGGGGGQSVSIVDLTLVARDRWISICCFMG